MICLMVFTSCGPGATIEYDEQTPSPSGDKIAAIAIYMTPAKWTHTLAVGRRGSSNQTQWVFVFDEPWPAVSVLEMHWKNEGELIVACVDNTPDGLPTSKFVADVGVRVVFDVKYAAHAEGKSTSSSPAKR